MKTIPVEVKPGIWQVVDADLYAARKQKKKLMFNLRQKDMALGLALHRGGWPR